MSFVKPHAPGGWIKSASTTHLNKIGPQKTVPLYDTIILKEGYLTVRRYKGKNTVSIYIQLGTPLVLLVQGH